MTHDDALQLSTDGDLHYASFDPSWGQGRAAFGGLAAAWLAQAMAPEVEGRPLRSMNLSFVGPLHPGLVEIHVRPLRAGRAMTMVEASLRQDGETAAVAVGSFGADRPTKLALPGPARPDWPAPEGLASLPFVPGVTPVFTQWFEYRWCTGGFPFSGSSEARLGGWIRPKDPRPADWLTVLMLLDAWPAPVLARADRVLPASTVSWFFHLDGAVAPGSPDAWWAFAAESTVSAHGYADVDARLWGPDGRLVASSRQLVVEFSG